MKDVLDLLAEANPIPPSVPLSAAVADPERILPLIEQRRHTMQTATREAPAKKKLRLVPLLVGVAVVAVTIGIVAAVGGDDGGVVASPDIPTGTVPEVALDVEPVPLVGATPVEVVETYLDRLSAGDLAGALELHGTEYRENAWTGIAAGGGTPAELVAKWSQYFVTLNGHFVHDCVQEGETVTCTVIARDDLSRALEVEAPVYEWEIEVADGVLRRGLLLPPISAGGQPDYGANEYAMSVDEFHRWARAQHVDEFLEACRGGGLFSSWSVDCARFDALYIDDFVATR